MDEKIKKQHWEKIYKTKNTISEVSWYQDDPQTSIDLILSTGVDKNDNIIDVGGGDSRVVDKLLEFGFKNIFILDISSEALQKAKIRLGEKAKLINWIEVDILKFDSKSSFDIWHDRAVFHFLIERADIIRYAEIVGKLVKPNGYFIISTFSLSGPEKCSGLDITRYSKDSIKNVFEKNFNQLKSFEEVHTTPFGTEQSFIFSLFKRKE